ncbi:hypothetical protein ACWGJ5_46280, partial [Streptomyces sp. NPDC054783]
TNVRLPPCAFDALTAVMARQGTSRDATVRRLLAEHVERQEQTDPDDRLTHISPVLRYPPPRWRKDPRQDRPLRLRASADLLERARAISLVLPGQYQRAFRDYQSRALTDAVVTAIAVAEPFTDDFLDADEGRRAHLQRGTTSYDWSGSGQAPTRPGRRSPQRSSRRTPARRTTEARPQRVARARPVPSATYMH